MASYESIGSCSLDVDITNSTSELIGSGSVSEQTLHSLELSANDPTTPEYVKRVAKLFEPVEAGPVSTEIQINGEPTKKPSYLGLACSISGYTTITNYDSKLREGFRSRDHSPGGRFIRSRDVSPYKCGQDQADCSVPRCGGNLLSLPKYYEGNLRSGTVEESRQHLNSGAPGNACEQDRVNGSSAIGRTLNVERNKMSSDRGTGLQESSRTFMSSMLKQSNFSDVESRPRTNGSATNGVTQNGGTQKHSPGSVRVVEFTSQTKSYIQNGAYTFSETKQYSETKSGFSETKSQFLESKVSEAKQQVRSYANGSDDGHKSFIQQRVERLYGPGALAQGFFRRTSSHTSHAKEQTSSKDEPSSSTASTGAALPVLRHLRPEFRAQLSLGTSAARKPAPAADEGKLPAPVALQTQVSVESVTDVLPAAPEVVLPIDQPAAIAAEVEVRPEVKDGAYFLGVLKREIDEINALVAATEGHLEAAAEGDIDDEMAGKLRTVMGQARLLVKQKLQQFEGLCHKNLSQISGEPFPTTDDDLAGFWDMVKLQVSQVHASFAEIDRLRANGWREAAPVVAAVAKRRSSGKQRPVVKLDANSDTRRAREEARRKLMEEKRREMREKAMKQGGDGVEIYVPDDAGK